MERSISVRLDASAAEVWDLLQHHAEELDPAIERFEVDGEPGVGALNRITFRGPLGLRLRAVSRIDEWDPPRRYSVTSLEPAWPLRSRATDELTDVDGGVLYEVTIVAEPARFARPLAGLWLGFIMRTRRQMMRRLETAVGAQR